VPAFALARCLVQGHASCREPMTRWRDPDNEQMGQNLKVAIATCVFAGLFVSAISLFAQTPPSRGALSDPQARLEVLPILFVPSDNAEVTAAAEKRIAALVEEHLGVVQQTYRRLLQTGTFAIADGGLAIYRSKHLHSYYRPATHGDAEKEWARSHPPNAEGSLLLLNEVFAWRHENRYNSRYIYLILYARPGPPIILGENPGFASAQPFNGLPNSGGGIVALELSSLLSDRPLSFQATLTHELGHSFGLSHPNCYGYGMHNNDGVMSYNPRNATEGTSPSPGILNPEDYFLLGKAKRVFPDFAYIEAKHNPHGRSLDRIESCFLTPLGEFAGAFSAQQRPGTGYELFYDGSRVSTGNAEFMSFKLAKENCRWNRTNRKDVRVACRYDGRDLDPGPAPVIPDLAGTWCENNRDAAAIEQSGEALRFKARGYSTGGTFLSNDFEVRDMVLAKDWENGLPARISADRARLDWANGPVWLRTSKCGP